MTDDRTGLLTLKDLVKVMREYDSEWMEMSIPYEGERVNVEITITVVKNEST